MTVLTKTEIGRAVDAIRSLSGIIEKLNKSTWPESTSSDILRKVEEPRANALVELPDAAKRVAAMLEDAERRMDQLEAGRDMDALVRKTYSIAQGAR
jgi:hypothetical protein